MSTSSNRYLGSVGACCSNSLQLYSPKWGLSLARLRVTFIIVAVLLASPAIAKDGVWETGTHQGVREASVSMGAGNWILVSCPLSSGGGSVFFTVGGSVKYSGNVLITFNGDEPFSLGLRDSFFGSATMAELSGYNRLIAGMKAHSWMNVRIADGRNTTFPLKGSSAAIGDCPAEIGRKF